MIYWTYFKKRWWIWISLGLYAGVLLLNAYGVHVWHPSCPISAYTDYRCLGCGMNHAAMELFRGELSQAWALNPLIFVWVPGTLFLLFHDLKNHWNKSHFQDAKQSPTSN